MDRDPPKEPPVTSRLRSTVYSPARSTNALGTTPLGGSRFTPGPPLGLSSAMRATATPVREQDPNLAAHNNHNTRFPPPKSHPTAPPVRPAGSPYIPFSRFLNRRPPAGDFNEPVIDVVTGKPFIPDPSKMAVMFVPGEGIVPDRSLAPSPYSPLPIAKQLPSLKLSTPSTAEDIVSKNADSIISQNMCAAVARNIQYTPPILRKPYLDKERRIQRAPVDPRIIGLPHFPESRKDDGRPYAKVLVDPKLRKIRFPDWIREQWLGAEWRRCESSEHVEVKSDRFDVIEYFRGETWDSNVEHSPEEVGREAMQPLCGINAKPETASEVVKEAQAMKQDQKSLVVLEETAKDPKAAGACTDSKATPKRSKVEEAELGVLETIAVFCKAMEATDIGKTGNERDAALAAVRKVGMRKIREKVGALNEAAEFPEPVEVGAEVGAALRDAQEQTLKESAQMASGLSMAAESNKVAKIGEAIAKAALKDGVEHILEKSTEPVAASTQAVESSGAPEPFNKAGEQDAAELSVLKGKAQIAKDVKEADQRIQDICKQLMSIEKLEVERKNSWLQSKKHADRNAVWKRNALANLKAASTLAEELHEKLRMIEAVEAARNQRIGAKPAVVTTQKVDHIEKEWVLLEDEMGDGNSIPSGGEGDFTQVLEKLSVLLRQGGNSHDVMKLVDRLRREKMSTAETVETIAGWIKEKTPKQEGMDT